MMEIKIGKQVRWLKAAALALPLAMVPVAVTQLASDAGVGAFGAAYAQDGEKKKEQETRRTPALRNKVYERLAEAQAPDGMAGCVGIRPDGVL